MVLFKSNPIGANDLQRPHPSTSAGKDSSRRNAVRQQLSAETLITAIEDIGDYRAFETAVIMNRTA